MRISFEVESNACWICAKDVEPRKEIEEVVYIYNEGQEKGRRAHLHCVINMVRLVMKEGNWDEVTYRVSELLDEAGANIFDF